MFELVTGARRSIWNRVAVAGAGGRAVAPVIEALEGRRLLSVVVSSPEARARPAAFFGWAAIRAGREFVGPLASGKEPAVDGERPSRKPIAPQFSSFNSGALAGKIVYLTAGHGLSAGAGSTGSWSTDRDVNNGVVEDYGNQDQLQSFADYILRAGGTVAPLRPIGNQSAEVVLDNDSPGVTFTGAWSNVTTGLHYDEDYGTVPDAVRFRFATISPAETATATYAPTFTQAGFYPVYTWVTSGTNRARQSYTVSHSGGATTIAVDHRNVGRGWVYLGTYHFETGQSGSVKISNQSASGTIVVADAIRFGNGMGDWDPGTGVSGRTRSEEAGLYWIIRSLGVDGGAGRQVSDYDTGDDGSANISAQPKFARDINSAPFGQSIYLSFHTNAGGGRGALALTNADGGTGNTTNQTRYAFLLGKEVNEDLRAAQSQLEAAWSTRTTYTYDAPSFDYGEISSGNTGNEFDATIIELAFHDDATDALFLKSPLGRDYLARATYQGVVRYFSEFGGGSLQFAPSAPTGLRTRVDSAGNIVLNWAAPPADAVNANSSVNTGPNGYAASGYEIQVSTNGYGFDTLATTSALTHTVAIPPGDRSPRYFRLVATNAGGQSPPSPVAAARPGGTSNGGATSRVLVVNAFDRNDSALSPTVSASISYNPPGAGTPSVYTRVLQRLANSFDYVVQAGRAIEAFATGGAQIGFDSANNQDVASGAVPLANYQTVVWLAGEESTVDETFSAAEQTAVATYVNGGGRLFASGAEIGWDLDRPSGPTSSDRAFYNNILRSDYVSDDAATYNVVPTAGGIFAGLSPISFDSGATTYDAQTPDVITPAAGSGAVAALSYSGGLGGAAAVQFASASPAGARVVSMAFPFETIVSAADRAAVMARVLNFFQTPVALDTVPPAVFAININDGNAQRSRINSLTIAFNEPVTLDPGAFTLARRSDGASPAITTANPSADGRTFLLGFSGPAVQNASLADGIWDLTILASAIADTSGNRPAANTTTTFHRLFGDSNGDKTINTADFAAFTAVYGSSLASAGLNFAWWFDADNSTTLNNADLLQLRSRNGTLFIY